MLERLKVVIGSVLGFSVLVVLAVHYIVPRGVSAQMLRQVALPVAQKWEPIAVTKVSLGGVMVQRGRFASPAGTNPPLMFPAGEDWVQNLTIYILNRTDQTIVHFEAMFSFPETTAGHERWGVPLSLGRTPDSGMIDAKGNLLTQPPDLQPLSFGPGQAMELHLGGYAGFVENTARAASLTTIQMSFQRVFFKGGTLQWSSGAVYGVYDPKTSKWQSQKSGYFPGDRDANWPGAPGWVDPR